MSLSFKEVAEIMKIIDSSSCEELVLEAEGMRLVVRRGGSSSVSPPAQLTTAAAATAAAVPQPASTAPKPASPTAAGGAGTHTERAPMVGTFYRRPSPDEAAFVEVGAKVSPGDPLCMIEVMKLYTTITASVAGVVDAILVDDTALVEFDQPLFVIRPA
ncbi:MAG: acetyl-CoA carboxylase biotin carboxyl carrier protein [Anderseniella sp.]|jgi:acetyl-CoA carboxylase biotin carboxyl carrier protein|nr:acetyl-CoA carboxylase biotin carboxyl carrier protein [Anderseniella sp.]